jgi:hypothetical protein
MCVNIPTDRLSKHTRMAGVEESHCLKTACVDDTTGPLSMIHVSISTYLCYLCLSIRMAGVEESRDGAGEPNRRGEQR